MPKTRKTRQQKEATAQKRQQAEVLQYSLKPLSTYSDHKQATPVHISSEYAYVTTDMRKTTTTILLLTGLQIFIFLLLKIHLIKIPGITY